MERGTDLEEPFMSPNVRPDTTTPFRKPFARWSAFASVEPLPSRRRRAREDPRPRPSRPSGLVAAYVVAGVLLAGGVASLPAEVAERRGETVVTLGPTFDVESLPGAFGRPPRAAAGPGGSFLVVWASDASAGDDLDESVQGRRFDGAGDPIGAQFQLNASTTHSQDFPSPLVHDDGSFVVAWQSFTDPPEREVFVRSWDASGMPVGGELQVNTFTTSQQSYASISGAGDGRAVVVWSSNESPGSTDSAVRGRLLGVGGAPVGAELQLSLQETDAQGTVDAVMRTDGSFLATWKDETPVARGKGPDPEERGIVARRFDSQGTGSLEELELAGGPSRPRNSRVDGLEWNRFVVAWEADTVRAARFEVDGSVLGAEIEVQPDDGLDHGSPALATSPDGRFVVAWDAIDGGSRTAPVGIRARAFDAAGVPYGDPLEIATTGYGADVTWLGGDDFLVVWGGFGEVRGRRMVVPDLASLFADGFESGDTGAWSEP